MNAGTERPILMSPMMVEAIMAGRKTETRRVLKGLSDEDDAFSFTKIVIDPLAIGTDEDDEDAVEVPLIGSYASFNDGESLIKCPFGSVGDVLWIKERTYWEKGTDFANVAFDDGLMIPIKNKIMGKPMQIPNWKPTDKKIWKGRPSMFMPKTLCRLRLKITELRVERLEEITEKDAVGEGVEPISGLAGTFYKNYSRTNSHAFTIAKKSFESLWESINGKGSWRKNPFVWVIGFKIKQNGLKPNE